MTERTSEPGVESPDVKPLWQRAAALRYLRYGFVDPRTVPIDIAIFADTLNKIGLANRIRGQRYAENSVVWIEQTLRNRRP